MMNKEASPNLFFKNFFHANFDKEPDGIYFFFLKSMRAKGRKTNELFIDAAILKIFFHYCDLKNLYICSPKKRWM